MRHRLLDLIVCPQCGGKLKVLCADGTGTEIEEGILGCERCPGLYPIAEGVPRMYRNSIHDFPKLGRLASGVAADQRRERLAEDPKMVKTRATFSQQWSEHRTGDVTWAWKITDRVELFTRELATPPGEFKGRLVLDAGCGNGELTNNIAALGAEVVGMDLSTSVVRANRQRQSDAVHFVQGDLTYNPLRTKTFDFIYSSGVLHYAADVEPAFRALADRVREGGRLYVWLYGAPDKDAMERQKAGNARAFRTKRWIVVLPVWAQRALLYPVALLWVFRNRYRRTLDAAKQRWFPGREQLTWRERTLLLPAFLYCRARDFRRVPPDTSLTVAHARVEAFNLFTPSYRSHHYFDEVSGWFGAAGFAGVRMSEVRATGFGVLGDRPVEDGLRSVAS